MEGGLCGLTFELSRPRRQTPLGGGRTIYNYGLEPPSGGCRSGSALERGVRRHCSTPGAWPRAPALAVSSPKAPWRS